MNKYSRKHFISLEHGEPIGQSYFTLLEESTEINWEPLIKKPMRTSGMKKTINCTLAILFLLASSALFKYN